MENCLEKAIEAFPEADREDMKKVFDKLSAFRQESFLAASGNPDATFRAQAKQLLEGYRLGIKIAEAKVVANIQKAAETKAFVRNPVFKSVADGIQALLTGTQKLIEGGRQSIAHMTRAHMAEMINNFSHELEQVPGAKETYMNGSLDAEILKEQAELANKRPGGITGNNIALAIAKARQNLQSAQLLKMNDAGAFVNDLEGRLMARIYDRAKLLALPGGEDEFVEKMLGWVNAEKSFKRSFENLDGEKVLRDIYRKVTEADEVGLDLDGDDSRDTLRQIQSPANLARIMERGRTIHIDSPTDEFQFMKEFGAGSLAEETVRSTMKVARRTAMIERLGTNPELQLTAMQKGLSTAEKAMIERHWSNVNGSATAPGVSVMAKAGLAARLFQDIKSLAFTSVAHFPNMASMAGLNSAEGANFWSEMGNGLAARLNNLSPAQKQEFLHLTAINAESKISLFHDAFSSQEGGKLKFLTKLHDNFMNLTLIKPMAELQDAANGQVLAGRIGFHSEKSFAQLDPQMAKVMQKYGIGPNEWEMIRAGVKTAEDGRNYGSVEGVKGIPVEQAKGILSKGGVDFKGVPDAAANRVVAKFQRDTATSLANYFNDRSAIATGRGGAFERAAFSNRGNSEDTFEGQLFRFLSQYKNYGFTMSSQFVPAMYNEAVKGAGARGAALTAQVLTGMTALGYLSYASKQMLMGRTAPTPMIDGEFHGDVAAKITEQAMMHSGALGIFNSFLMDDFDSRHGKNILSYLGGPMASLGSDAADLLTDVRSAADRTNPGAVKASAVSRFTANALLGNMLGVRQGLDYLWLNNLSETLNPGYTARTKQRLSKQGQAPMLPWAQGYTQ